MICSTISVRFILLDFPIGQFYDTEQHDVGYMYSSMTHLCKTRSDVPSARGKKCVNKRLPDEPKYMPVPNSKLILDVTLHLRRIEQINDALCGTFTSIIALYLAAMPMP